MLRSCKEVLGAHLGGSLLYERAFRPSMADYLMQHTGLPLFIAHNKS